MFESKHLKRPLQRNTLKKREKYIRNALAVLTLFFFLNCLCLHYTDSFVFSFFFLCLDPSTFFVNNSFHLECFFPISHNNIQFNIASIFLTHSGNPKVGHPTCTTWTQSRASSITSPTIITNHAMVRLVTLPLRDTLPLTLIIDLRGCGSAPTEAYKANPITLRIPVKMHKSRTDFQRLATYPTSGEEISWPKGLAAITQPRNFLSALGSICIVTEISLNGRVC